MKIKSWGSLRLFKNNREGMISGFLILFIILSSVGLFENFSDNKKIIEINAESEDTKNKLNGEISNLENSLKELREEKEGLENILSDEQKAKLELERQKERDSKKIDTLEKLTTIDPELLKKYSKIFFLSENYSPPKLSQINSDFWIKKEKEIEVLRDIKPFINNLLEDARDDGLNLRVLSGYRSFDDQTSLKANYTILYGTGANQFSADQGYSEHQLGTTVDFTTPTIVGAELSFENTEEFRWLEKNAHKYGFILSYPKDNKYYIYEPWHWRFVGIDLAEDLKDDGEEFYERDQRSIDKYLIKIFDK